MTNLHRVYGPPGCGKTTWLARQCWLATGRHGADAVHVASLTRAAAHEVAGRDTGLPRGNVGTLHAHAFRALDRPPLAETPDGLREWNAQARPGDQLTGAAARDPEWANPEDTTTGRGSSDADRLLADAGVLRARMLPVSDWPGGGDHGRLAAFHRRWCAWKEQAGRLDFTDLIEQCLADEKPIGDGRCRVLLLDEAQDMSALEVALARRWSADADELVMVGDPDQNLYQWRGSDPSAFTGEPARTERVLSQSYRVPRAVHSYAVDWVERIEGRPPVAYEPTAQDGDVRELHAATYREPAPLARALAADAARGETAMALASCAYMLAPLVAELRERGTPFHNPYRPTNGSWNPLAGMQRLAALLRQHEAVWGADAGLWTWRDVWRFAEPLKAPGVFQRGSKGALEELAKARDQFDGSDRGDRQADPAALASHLTDEAAAAIGTGDLDWYEQHLLESWRDRMRFPLAVARSGRPLAELREMPRIVIGTIHSVKGAEADSVYVMPDLSIAAYHGPAGQPAARGWATGGDARDPTIRQFYVAFTRARARLTLCGAATGMEVAWPRA